MPGNQSSPRIVDLTMPLEPDMPAYPGEPSVRFTPFTTIERDGVAMASVGLFSQIGTHVDAPAHFVPGTRTVERLDLAKCVGPATMLRLGTLAPGSVIGASHLMPFGPRLGAGARVILSTGWSSRAGTASYFQDWPVLGEDAVHLLDEAGIDFLGLDTPSPGTDITNVRLHSLLFRREIVLAECLVNVDLLPDRFELICLPLPLAGLDGSPVRAIARV
ncbi:cyclase family protein [Microbispora siamensis]|uniref:Cyclase n=1 Tax=Microbispora siamensis TaxID=564413 RepID=A0ABQ4GRW1_9ACTN|nr:cyclase family protein [Microbispora siamensis]GIH64128.1 cyclase [Microbispora siamensis]